MYSEGVGDGSHSPLVDCVCVVRITVTKNKLYWCHGYLLVQNADCRLQTGYKM